MVLLSARPAPPCSALLGPAPRCPSWSPSGFKKDDPTERKGYFPKSYVTFKKSMDALNEMLCKFRGYCYKNGVLDMVMVHEYRSGPHFQMVFCDRLFILLLREGDLYHTGSHLADSEFTLVQTLIGLGVGTFLYCFLGGGSASAPPL